MFISWFENPPDTFHSTAAVAITEIWIRYPSLAEAIAQMPWIADGVSEGESIALESIGCIVSKDTELANMVAGFPWFVDDITEKELDALSAFERIASTDAALAKTLVALPWFSGNVTIDKLDTLNALWGIISHDVETAKIAADLPWLKDRITHFEQSILWILAELASDQRDLARLTVALPWFADGVTRNERSTILSLREIAQSDLKLARKAADLTWLADGVTDDEFIATQYLSSAASENLELAQMIVDRPWFTNSIDTDNESWAISRLVRIAEEDPELARTIATLPMLNDGITEEQRDAIFSLDSIAENDLELAKMLAGLPWFVNGIVQEENLILEALSYIASKDAELANTVANLPWFTDGVIEDESRVLNALNSIAGVDADLASELAAFVKDTTRDLDIHAIEALGGIASQGPDVLAQLTSQPWFSDGIEDEDLVLLVILGSVVHNSKYRKQYSALLHAPITPAKTIFLPMAGEVNIWIVRNPYTPQNEVGVNLPPRFIFPSMPDDALQTIMEDAARVTEDFLGIPLPTTDIILLTPPVDERFGGSHYGTHIAGYPPSIPHEIAHYYTHGAPGWFVEGMATFLDAYVGYQTAGDPNYFSERRAGSSAGVRSTCRYDDEPIENIRHYNYIVKYVYDGGDDDWFQSNLWHCTYPIGENLSFAVYDAIGEDAMSAAVRELYLQSIDSGQPAGEEDIYRAFLKHAPSDKKDAFRDVYQRLHGGAFAFDDVDFDDDHGDQAALATEIAVGETAEGALDYMFDFDYFKFPAEGGQRYRINVVHPWLRTSSVTMYSRDGTTRLGRRADTPESSAEVASGVRILWTARRDGMYHVAVQNFGGKTGSYTLTITPVDDDSDD